MNRREKILLFLVVGTLGLGIGLKVVREQVIERFRRWDQDITRKKSELQNLEGQRHLVKIQKERWERLARETLASDVPTARTRFINELDALSHRHGLENVSVRPSEAGSSTGPFTLLNCTVDAEGTLAQIVPFVRDLHNQPFMVRLRMVTLLPLTGKQQGKLRVSLKAETVVLAYQKLVPQVVTAELAEGKRKEVLRASEDPKAYMAIVEKNLFEPYKEPPVVTRVDPPPPPPATQAAPPPPVAAAPPPPARKRDPGFTSTRITALLSTPDTQEVVVTDGAKKRRVYKVGDEFDGGTLVYVHPDGAVVVYKPEGAQEAEKNFYPLGKLMSEMTVLTENVPADHIPPVVLHEVLHVISRMQQAGRSESASGKGSGS